MSCHIKLTKVRFLSVFSIYALTMSHFDENFGQFYDDLSQLFRKGPITDKQVILENFNASVGNDNISCRSKWDCKML